ncbi:TonB-dependent receptor [Daejeonella sp. JGW-45]|uniref:SusC/RagA family TonB-linked outer membrane protein n=1 Tax=Daejeonella sp. JGW-45 TaxID=3034148 RepID=UPI0023EB8C9E|nr:TonB-dependent receptor [Daejeonella sp. JGW-45]
MNRKFTKFFRKILIPGSLLAVLVYDAGAQERSNVFRDSVASVRRDSVDIPLLNGSRPFRYVTGAVSHVFGGQLSTVPGSNRLNSLAGRLPGFFVSQTDGLPGFESSTVAIRGYHSFSGSNSPLILVNGRRDDVAMIEPNDIESITILKDAASTVLYGMNSRNGIVLITTKKGTEGKIKINYNAQTSFQQPTRLPKFLDSYNYATLYNEAMLNDNPNGGVKYDATALSAYQTGSDPFKYPNVDWTGQLLKDYSMQTRNNLNISGGGKTAKYFFSGSYLSEGGIFNVDKSVNTYNTNTNIDAINVRANIELDISKNLKLLTDVRSKRDKRNAPGAYSASYDEGIFAPLYNTPANAYPIKNADGSLGGTNEYTNNPYGMLNYRGYSNYITTSLSTFSELTYNLGSLVKGLQLKGNFGFTNYTQFMISRAKNFEVYSLNPNGTTYTKIGLNSPIAASGGYDQVVRIFDHSLSLNYDREIGKHNISAMVMYDRDQIDNVRTLNLTQNFQGPKASLSYRFNNKYLLDLAASYEGSEQYPKGDRYGFFPAVSAGWIASEEDFLKGSGIDFLKLRGSYGRTGNPAGTYFEYLGAYSQANGTGGIFGTTPAASIGIGELKIANNTITWEKSLKANAGIDIALLKNRLHASADYFNEDTKDILIRNAISGMYGADINSSAGRLKNKGFEFQAGWTDQIKDFRYSVNLNYSRADNEIIYSNEQLRPYPWMYTTGNPYGTRRGYVFDRFFTEQDNISALPNQTLLGTQKPGDLKYKDLNGDNIIDENDMTDIGDARLPQVHFGANFGVSFKGFDLNALFQGTRNSTTYNSGSSYWEFTNRTGNASEHHLDRWVPGSGQSAGYPRLTLSNPNNFVSNSYWVQDNSFVRLKFLELGYSLPAKLVSKIKMTGARIFLNGNNVFVWDDVSQKDPEIQDNGLSYPLQRTISLGLSAKF